ncbi:MAG: DUF177 domain-containing protein [Candidatus Omnitrophica bacterium]|nr:DUF177 domain-containing protein [Candidatus Omnitrophota bacterium]
MIKISVRDIPSVGLNIDQRVPKEGIGLSDEEADIRSPLSVKAHLEKANNVIVADTHVTADFGYLCARCLKELSLTEERSYKFDFEVDPTVEYIDLGEEIRQEIIMANPTRILCSKDCKGICSKCGVNLNTEKCKCKK